MQKRRIIIDLDNTVLNTIKAICDLYNEDFSYYSDFKPIDWQDVKTWDFTELTLASREYINKYFNQPRFFNKVRMMSGAEEVINDLSNYYEIVFCSMCYSPNGRGKERWIKEHFPYAKFININMKEFPDKSHIDMSSAIFIDDDERNLTTSNAAIKVCFGEVYPWNKQWNGDRCYIWRHVYHYINRIREEEENNDNED